MTGEGRRPPGRRSGGRPGAPRVGPLPPEERVGTARALLEDSILPGANIFTTLVRHEGLFRRWLPFGGKLLRGRLPARERELLILRTAWLCRAEYEWAQHVVIGARAGLTEVEMRRLRAEPGSPAWADWSELEALVLSAVDELHDDWYISDSTWEGLSQRYGVEEMIEVAFVVGHYHMVAGALNSLGVQLDEGLSGFGDT
ncbi:MAG: carboxymuconolactone decarboxylase family protein [Acidimicrobiales bacterium]